MPLTIPPPQGTPMYYREGKHNESVVAFSVCSLALPSISHLSALTENKRNGNCPAKWSVAGPVALYIRESAADTSFKLESNAAIMMKASAVTSRFYEQFNLKKLFS